MRSPVRVPAPERRAPTKKLKTVLGRAAAFAGMYSRRFRSSMTIVAFHRVNDSQAQDGLTCSPDKFLAFCKFFQQHFRVVPLSHQVAACRTGRDMGGTLSITFDDGYRDNFTVAAPVLRELGLPATFFVTTSFIGSRTIPPWDAHLAVPPSWMTWDHLRALQAQGFEIGCHTDTHIDMGSAAPGTIRAELAISKRKIREELGVAPELFAYPFGGREHITEISRSLVREASFTCCASCHGGVNLPIADPYALKRIGIAEWFDTPDQFGFELIMNRTEISAGAVTNA
jgi:peptidoglycan/xylan/chitin deacetylase (PgdA/CDA1 family)